MKNKGALIAISIIGTLGLIIYIFKDAITSFFTGKKENSQAADPEKITEIIKYYPKDNGGDDGENAVAPVPEITEIDKDRLLKKGSKGKEVKTLQTMLNNYLKVKKKQLLSVDGSFGTKTENALYFAISKRQTSLSEFTGIMFTKLGK